jgi:AraC-like DNA-binding protein
MAIIIYWLSIKGYLAAQTGTPLKKAATGTQILSATAVQQAATTLRHCMEYDKLYLNPLLNLEAVSQHTSLPAKTISAVLNQYLNKSFNEFVNEYRVNAFIQKMQQPGAASFTMAGLANDCGFNSQATFQRTFKQVTGMPPTEYRKLAPATR